MKLLTRQEFKQKVFARSKGLCVFCGHPAQDAHHVIERRLWPDGGYYIDNGAAVCGPCHLKCESDEYTVEDVRYAAQIDWRCLPPSIYKNDIVDKWGNSKLANGTRMRGPLGGDESVKKILSTNPNFSGWADEVKYPRTPHLPESPALLDKNPDDFTSRFNPGGPVVFTIKMDGENTTLYSHTLHARSLDYAPHESRNLMKKFWAERAGDIPPGFRICGENLYAKHSIGYEALPSFFLGFSIWDGLECLSWAETKEWFTLLDITYVPVLLEAEWSEQSLKKATDLYLKAHGGPDRCEGFVVRDAGRFHSSEFNKSMAKYVRKNHVSTDRHWRHKPVTPNRIKDPTS